jgi:uncharacterized protein (TIGR04255 family)
MVESSFKVSPGRAKDLPDFAQPPVVEVALGVQFDPLSRLDTPWIARFWLEEVRDRFPDWTESVALPPAIEWFGIPAQPRVMFRFGQGAVANRAVFQDASKTGLLQLQQDRLVRNWRKIGTDDSYPRYEAIRTSFSEEVSRLRQFLATCASRAIPRGQSVLPRSPRCSSDSSSHRGARRGPC